MPDRRVRSLRWWHWNRLHGNRSRGRRATDELRPYLVERVSGWALALSGLLLVLTLVDGVLTVCLIDHGYVEANPLMLGLLNHGVGAFFLGKFLLTAALLPPALVAARYRVLGTALRVGHLVPAVTLLYLLLIAYQVELLYETPVAPGDSADRSGSPVIASRLARS